MTPTPMAGKTKTTLPDSVGRIARACCDGTQFSQDNELFSRLTIKKARNCHSAFRSADFVVQGVGPFVFNTVKAIAEDVCFGLAMSMHGDHGSVRVAQAYELHVSYRLIQCFSVVIHEK